MAPARALQRLAGAALLLLAAPVPAGEVCEAPPANGPVSLLILSSPAKVRELALSVVEDTPVVAQAEGTVVFADGRVITSDPEAAGRALNRLGWSSRRIDVVATLPRRRAGPVRRGGG